MSTLCCSAASLRQKADAIQLVRLASSGCPGSGCAWRAGVRAGGSCGSIGTASSALHLATRRRCQGRSGPSATERHALALAILLDSASPGVRAKAKSARTANDVFLAYQGGMPTDCKVGLAGLCDVVARLAGFRRQRRASIRSWRALATHSTSMRRRLETPRLASAWPKRCCALCARWATAWVRWADTVELLHLSYNELCDRACEHEMALMNAAMALPASTAQPSGAASSAAAAVSSAPSGVAASATSDDDESGGDSESDGERRSRRRGTGRNRGRARRGGGNGGDRQRSRSRESRRETRSCFDCGERGHLAEDCPRRRGASSGSRRGGGRSRGGKPHRFDVERWRTAPLSAEASSPVVARAVSWPAVVVSIVFALLALSADWPLAAVAFACVAVVLVLRPIHNNISRLCLTMLFLLLRVLCWPLALLLRCLFAVWLRVFDRLPACFRVPLPRRWRPLVRGPAVWRRYWARRSRAGARTAYRLAFSALSRVGVSAAVSRVAGFADAILRSRLAGWLRTALGRRAADEDAPGSSGEMNWCLDSGASGHSTTCRSALHNIRPIDPRFVQVADGRTMMVVEEGDIELMTARGEITLTNVTHMPYSASGGHARHRHINLVSLSCFAESGGTVSFTSEMAVGKRGDRIVLEADRGVHEVYMLRAQTVFPTPVSAVVAAAVTTKEAKRVSFAPTVDVIGDSAATAETVRVKPAGRGRRRRRRRTAHASATVAAHAAPTTRKPKQGVFGPAELELWHRRLAHVNEQALRRMHDEGIVDGLKGRRHVVRCEVCRRAKMTRNRFGTELSQPRAI